jgi:hypothetical protein
MYLQKLMKTIGIDSGDEKEKILFRFGGWSKFTRVNLFWDG